MSVDCPFSFRQIPVRTPPTSPQVLLRKEFDDNWEEVSSVSQTEYVWVTGLEWNPAYHKNRRSLEEVENIHTYKQTYTSFQQSGDETEVVEVGSLFLDYIRYKTEVLAEIRLYTLSLSLSLSLSLRIHRCPGVTNLDVDKDKTQSWKTTYSILDHSERVQI